MGRNGKNYLNRAAHALPYPDFSLYLMSHFFNRMRKFLLPLVLLAGRAFGQQHHCYTTEMQERWFTTHPEMRAEYERLQQQAADADREQAKTGYQNVYGKSASSVSNYTIPVVFHILHLGGSENISDAQVKDAVDILTRDFNCNNADTANVVYAFKNKIGNPQFKFALATKDPNGNCTNGIIRHYDANTDWTNDFADYIYSWPRNRYLNVYVVRTMGGGAAGYTYLPGSGVPASADAIVILSTYIGSIGTGNVGTSRALTHEVGHWFNLQHTWGGSNQPGVACGDDGVSDTPITKGYTSCNLNNTAICNPSVQENIQNYMDYAYCQRMFTIGQSTRMINSINSTVAGRNNISTSGNLALTGANNTPTVCAPMVQLVPATTLSVCVGQTLTLKTFTANGNPTSYAWSGNNGVVVSNPSAANAQVMVGAAGPSTVNCVVSNAAGSYTQSILVTGLSGVADVSGAYSESFESLVLPQGWSLVDPNAPNANWVQTSDAASLGYISMLIAGENLPPNAVRVFESPSYDFKNNPGALYTFKYAYRRSKTSTNDIFKVQVSGNCGGSWTDVYVPGAYQLAQGSGETGTALFYPITEWKLYDLTQHPNFAPFLSNENVRMRFYFQEDAGGSGYGNRMYIDEVNFTTPTGVNELTRAIGLGVYPNPSSGAFAVRFSLSDQSSVRYTVSTVSGAEAIASQQMQLAPGEHTFSINSDRSLMPGVYFLTLDLNGSRMCRKLIVE